MPIPSTGSFRILVGVVASRDGDFQAGNVVGDCIADAKPSMSSPNIEAYLNANTGGANGPVSRSIVPVFCAPTCYGIFPSVGLHRLTFNPATDEFIFNPGGGQEVVDFLSSDFPTGVIVTALQVHFKGSVFSQFLPGGIVDFELLYNGQVVHSVAAPDIVSLNVDSSTIAIIPSGEFKGILSALGIFGTGITHALNYTISAGACGNFTVSAGYFNINELYVLGDYALWSSGLSLTPDSVNTIQDLEDTIFTLTDTENKLLQLTNLYVNDTAIEITDIITHTAGAITFRLPASTPADSILMIVAAGDGTEFSGTTNVGLISIILVNGSGIYTLVPGKTNDTYYNRSVDPVETVDLAIPTPRFKTGYFGG